jgi:transmembrane sensor
MTDEHLGPPPVEPMSDLAWARVERGMWARLDHAPAVVPAKRRWVWLAVPAMAAAAAVVIAVLALREGPSPTLPSPAPVASTELSRVVSGASPSSITFADAHIALDANSALVLTSEGTSPATLLERGAAWFTVAPRADRPAFIVRAGDTAVRVIGTRFRVARSDERISVEVEHGLVEVVFRGTTARVGPAQQWSSEHPGEVEAAAVQTARVEVPSQTTDPATVPAVAPPVTTKRAAGRPATDTSVIDKPAAGTSTATPVTDTDHARYDHLASMEARDPEAALAGYLDLSRGAGPWAQVALYAAGRLAADRHDHRAETLLTIYLRRFPSGANAADARQLLDRLKGDHP